MKLGKVQGGKCKVEQRTLESMGVPLNCCSIAGKEFSALPAENISGGVKVRESERRIPVEQAKTQNRR